MASQGILARIVSTTASSSSPLAYQAIKHRLGRCIGSRWKAGSRLPPIAELARDLGTGQRNTHRAVQELVREGILVSRPGMGTFVSGEFQVSQLPESQANAAFGLDIAQVPAHLADKRVVLARNAAKVDGFQSLLADIIVRELNQAGLPVTETIWTQDKSGRPEPKPSVLASADAVALINPAENMPIEPAPGQIMTVITMGLDLDLHATSGVDFVSVDQVGSAMLAGRRLREAGCESACFIGAAIRQPDGRASNQYDKTASLRIEGFERGWGDAIAPANKLYAEAYDVCVGARMVRQYLELDPRPQGIFCATDELAVGFVIGALTAGLEPGTDYKLIGFDGQPIGRNLGEGPLTTIEAPLEEMASRAAELLISRLDQPEQPVRRLALGCRLFEGQTVDVARVRVKARRIYH